MGGAGAATVVVAQPDHGRRELLARIIEAAGQNAVRLEATDPPVVVDTTVESSALVLVLDATAIGFGDLDAIVGAFATRRYPAKVIALVDGPASAASASSAGASVALERPFQRDDFVAAMADLLGIDVPAPAEPSPAEAVATIGDIAVADIAVEQAGDDRLESDVESADAQNPSEEAIDLPPEAADLVGHVDPIDVDGSTDNEPDGAAQLDHDVETVLILGEAAEPDEWDLIEAEGRVAFGSGGHADAPDEPPTGTDAAEQATTNEPDNDERAEGEGEVDEANASEDDAAEDHDDEEVVDGDKARPLGMDHSFTDILRMGRQL